MAKIHGMGRHPLFKAWCEMRYRCENTAKWNYKYYGARGIRVCDRWQHFPNFVADMGPRPKGTTLDRRNLNGNYELGNCRWATKKEQANNTSASRIIEFRGESLTLAQWADRIGIKTATLWARLENGKWPVERALTQALRPY